MNVVFWGGNLSTDGSFGMEKHMFLLIINCSVSSESVLFCVGNPNLFDFFVKGFLLVLTFSLLVIISRTTLRSQNLKRKKMK